MNKRTSSPPIQLGILMLGVCLLSGCGPRQYVATPDVIVDPGWTERKLEEKELKNISQDDPDLDKKKSLEILARLNTRDKDYIQEDIKKGKPIKVPNDFSYYKSWTPMPEHIPEVSKLPKFILVVKDVPFIGWYEKGKLKSDTYICIGKKGEWTKAGHYQIANKDVDHVSQSYKNAYGEPALMPWALRIYGHVWIHAGDIEKSNCSHGCINLPISPAEQLFNWADVGTSVLVVESLKDLKKAVAAVKPPPAKKPAKIAPAPQRGKPAVRTKTSSS